MFVLLTHKVIVVADPWYASLMMSFGVQGLVHHHRHNLHGSYFVSISLGQSRITFKILFLIVVELITFVFNCRLWDFPMTVALCIGWHCDSCHFGIRRWQCAIDRFLQVSFANSSAWLCHNLILIHLYIIELLWNRILTVLVLHHV